MMEARSRGHTSPPTTNGQSPSSGSQSPIVPPSSTSTGSSSPGTPQPPQPLSTSSAISPEPPSSFSPVPAPEAQQPHTPLPATTSPAPPAAAPPPKRSIISRLFGTSPAPDPSPPQPGRSRQGVTHGCFSVFCLSAVRGQADSCRRNPGPVCVQHVQGELHGHLLLSSWLAFCLSLCWTWTGTVQPAGQGL